MNKKLFLQNLKEALQNEVNPDVITENINYYDDYIKNEVKNGTKEKDVLASLGDPWIIAKSIIQTQGTERDAAASVEANERAQSRRQGNHVQFLLFDTWWKKLLALLVVVLFLVVVVLLITGLIRLLAPVAIPIIIVLIILRIYGSRRR